MDNAHPQRTRRKTQINFELPRMHIFPLDWECCCPWVWSVEFLGCTICWISFSMREWVLKDGNHESAIVMCPNDKLNSMCLLVAVALLAGPGAIFWKTVPIPAIFTNVCQ